MGRQINEQCVTIHDVAKKAKTSITTVSRVINNTNYPVKEEVRLRVIEAAKDLNYKPNVFSRRLRGVPSQEIGIIIPSITNPFYAQIVSGVEKECIKNGFIPIICSSYNNTEIEKRHIEMFRQKDVAGIMLSSISEQDEYFIELLNSGMKIVMFDQNYINIGCDTVSFDFYKGGRIAVQYLIDEGHKDIALLVGVIDRRSRQVIKQAYKDTLKYNGILFEEKRLVTLSQIKINDDKNNEYEYEYEYEEGCLVVEELLKQDKLPTAIVAINDIMALGIISRLMERGIKVPDDISVIGFDNISVSGMVTPALTTINQPSYDTGVIATQMLLKRINNVMVENNQILLKPTLVERKSVRNIVEKGRE